MVTTKNNIYLIFIVSDKELRQYVKEVSVWSVWDKEVKLEEVKDSHTQVEWDNGIQKEWEVDFVWW